MDSASLRSCAAVTFVLMMATSGLAGVSGGHGGDRNGGPVAVGGPAPMDVAPWTDDFDDTSRVNTTQGTEVVGGEVRLVAGQSTGLVASVAITPPPGYRYDILVVEVDTPGDTKVSVSVLNATEDSTKVGYVNEPVPGFLKLERTHVPLLTVSTRTFPQLRLQADLEAAGTDRPALLSWTVHFLEDGMWRDEFLGTGKMRYDRRLSVSGGTAGIDLSIQNRYVTGFADHGRYPPLVVNRYHEQQNRLEMTAFYPGVGGYQAGVRYYAKNPGGFAAGDLDGDGYLDLVVANYRDGADPTVDSWVLWGNDTGQWDVGRRTPLYTDRGRRPALGDVDGDGDLDVTIACGGGAASGHVRVFINPGDRTWSGTHDASLPGEDIEDLASADLDGDGYDDLVLAENHVSGTNVYSRAYLGGPGGLDTTAALSFPTGLCYVVALEDLDRDGHVDVAFANTLPVSGNDRAHVFLGGVNGPDEESDYQLDVPTSDTRMSLGVGDINGDGWPDLAFGRSMQQPRVYVFWGGAAGYSNGRRADPRIATSMWDCEIIDVDDDGYDDVVSSGFWTDRVDVYRGSASNFDGDSDLRLNTRGENTALGVGAGRRQLPYLWGSFTTKAINRPLDKKWDVLVLEGDLPPGTEVEIDVLDTGLQPILGFTGLKGPDVDLSSIPIPSINVRVTLRSTDLANTPSLERLFVKWMDKGAWRDEFYGEAKVDSLLNMRVNGRQLEGGGSMGGAEELVFANLRNDDNYNVPGLAYRDAGGLDYASLPPLQFPVGSGAGAVEAGDFDGDGNKDIVFAAHQAGPGTFIADSPMYLGTPVGWRSVPDHSFPTKGAQDVLVTDLNGDGHSEVVFAQEHDGTTTGINSTLFWGSASGWNHSADLEFETSGASAVVAVDIDGNGLDDLVFANNRDDDTTEVDSVVFLQTASGFDGSSPDRTLATRGARGVAAGDIDGDDHVDLVFANRFSEGFVDILSYVYWGAPGGTFVATPTDLPTHGAADVEVADVNGDGDLDVVFACSQDNSLSRAVDSFVYLGDGSRSLGPTADISLPTLGASAVAVADLDGTGWRDLVFACQHDGASYEVESRAFLGGSSGYAPSPDITVPTWGASDVTAVHLVDKDRGGYLSLPITPEDPENAGVFHTLIMSFENQPPGVTGTIQVLDADTFEVLAEADIYGPARVDLSKEFRIREHDSVRLQVSVSGLAQMGTLAIDQLWLNWTPRIRAPPRVLAIDVAEQQVYRTQSIGMTVNVTDEYDYLNELEVEVEHRPSDGSGGWARWMIEDLRFTEDTWSATIRPRVSVVVGLYDLRARVTDSDGMESDWMVLGDAFEVLNNPPTAPGVRIDPSRPVTESTLEALITSSSTDIESSTITYRYAWYLDGNLMENLTSNRVGPNYLERGQNWSVEVRAHDGDGEGPPGTAWRVIQNAPPRPGEPLDDPRIEEDVPDSSWIMLKDAFFDPDGDDLTWWVDPPPDHLDVDIDPDTGRVTITPRENWWGEERVVFWASDGEFEANQSVTVYVDAVNDPPRFTTVNGNVYMPGAVISMTVEQGQELDIQVTAVDVEGHDLTYRVNRTEVTLDSDTGHINWTPGNLNVGWLNLSLSLSDNVDPDLKQYVNFTVRVTNKNDPLEEVVIISPQHGERYEWNSSVGLRGRASDPDERWGDRLEYTWRSNRSGALGTGPILTYRFTMSGVHNITLNVTDGQYYMEAWVHINVGQRPEPPKPPKDGDDDGGLSLPLLAGIAIIIIVVVVVALALVLFQRRAIEQEPIPEPTEEERKRKELEAMAVAMKGMADAMEEEWDAEKVERSRREMEEARAPAISVEGTGMVPTSAPAHRMRLSEDVSEETARLWADMEQPREGAGEAEREKLRQEVLQRKVRTVIESMPYGVPAPELKSMPADELAKAVVEGARHRMPDGTELVAIGGRWYHADHEDSSTFLKEYKAPARPGPGEQAAKAGIDASDWEESE